MTARLLRYIARFGESGLTTPRFWTVSRQNAGIGRYTTFEMGRWLLI